MKTFPLLALVLAGTSAASAAPLPAGSSSFTLPNAGEPLEIFTHRPAGYTDGPLLVVIHGSDRNAAEYRDYAAPLAARARALVVAPLFDAARFSDERYKRTGGVLRDGREQPREAWTFQVIARLVAAVREREGRPALPYYVIGHSGGAQFTARLAFFLPGEARGFVAANSGSYTFPAPEIAFPFGTGGLPAALADDGAWRRYLAAPLTVYLGTGDVKQDPAEGFDFSPEAMRQGAVRLERGRNYFAACRALAAKNGWPFRWRLVETPGIGHSGEKMFSAPEALSALFP